MNKVEKIRKEIERLKAETFDNKELSLEEIIAVRNCYNNLLFFIDSLEQPIKRTPADIESAMQEVEEKSKLFTEAHKDDVVSNDTIDDLEEAAKNYEEDAIFYAARRISDFFKAGAQWQKEQMIDKACEWLSNVSIEDMTYKYNDFDTSEDWYKFIEDFKKAVEE